jgi:hypothetical protein
VVSSRSKIEEVQFYLDRNKEAVITLIQSILQNPRLDDHERFAAMRALGEHHRVIADFVCGCLEAGQQKGYAIEAQSHAK